MNDRPETGRAHLPGLLGDGRIQLEALQLALQQAVVGLEGLGGMVHLGGGENQLLHLVSAVGIPQDILQEWRSTDGAGRFAPAQALRGHKVVWLSSADPRVGFLTFGTGIAAAPLCVSEGRTGVISIVTATPGPPTAPQRHFLMAVARWASARTGHSASPASLPPAESSAGGPLRKSAEAVGVGAWDWNIRTGEVVGDEAALAALGIAPDTFDGRPESVAAVLDPAQLRRAMADIAEAFVTRGEYAAEYRVRGSAGRPSWVQVRGRVILGEDGEPAHLGGALWDATESRSRAESADRALQHLGDAFVKVDPDWRITYLNLQAERLLGLPRTLIGPVLWDDRNMGSLGLEDRCKEHAVNGTSADFDVQWPTGHRWYHIRFVPSPDGSAFHFVDVTDKRLLDAERLAAERSIAERAGRISQLTSGLSRAVTVRDVVDAIAAGVLPPFGANGLVVQLIEAEFLRVVGAFGYPQGFVSRVGRTKVEDPTPNADALRERAPQYLTSSEEFARRYPDFADHAFRGGKQAWVFLPLIVSGRPMGCCVISFAQPRRFSEEEHTLLTAISGLIAQALERARLYDAEHGQAEELQRGLLPRNLPALPAVTTAAHYLPTGVGVGLGGDWYDVIPLSADRVALVIGDVMGHGFSEAVTMGRLRTVVHTLSSLELPPEELLAQVNDTVGHLGDDYFATCLYALYDPATRICTFTSAGHPPPALLHPDGTVHFPELALNPPLGAATPPFETTELEVPDGSILVLYTDGLVESVTRDIESGMRQLAAALAASYDGGDTVHAQGRGGKARSPASTCDALIADLLPAKETISDDAAVLVAGMHGLAPGQVASWDLPDDPVAAGEAREHIRQQLDVWQLDDLSMTTELLASELISNCVRHAQGPVGLRLLYGRVLTCEVSDHSLTTPRIRRASDTDEGGRGLQLVAALSQRWGARYTAEGKCIWTEQALLTDRDSTQ